MIGEKVLVTTDKRGVFFGTLTEQGDTTVVLDDIQNCSYWDASMRGFLGLASQGPSDKCRISQPAPSSRLEGVISITICTGNAAARWKKAPWSS